MQIFLPLDVAIDPAERMSSYLAAHSVAFILLGAAVVVAIALLVVLFKKSNKRGS